MEPDGVIKGLEATPHVLLIGENRMVSHQMSNSNRRHIRHRIFEYEDEEEDEYDGVRLRRAGGLLFKENFKL